MANVPSIPVLLGLPGAMVSTSDVVDFSAPKVGGHPVFAGSLPGKECLQQTCAACQSRLSLILQVLPPPTAFRHAHPCCEHRRMTWCPKCLAVLHVWPGLCTAYRGRTGEGAPNTHPVRLRLPEARLRGSARRELEGLSSAAGGTSRQCGNGTLSIGQAYDARRLMPRFPADTVGHGNDSFAGGSVTLPLVAEPPCRTIDSDDQNPFLLGVNGSSGGGGSYRVKPGAAARASGGYGSIKQGWLGLGSRRLGHRAGGSLGNGSVLHKGQSLRFR
jgi:hypothetical protein